MCEDHWYAAYGAEVWHVYGFILLGAAASSFPRCRSRREKMWRLQTERSSCAETQLSTSWWVFVCFGFFIHNFAALYTELKDREIISHPEALGNKLNCSPQCLHPVTHVKTKRCSRKSQFCKSVHPPERDTHTQTRTHTHTHAFFSILLLFICWSFTVIVGQRNPSLWHWYEQQLCSSKKRHLVTRGCLSSAHNVGIMWCFRALSAFKNNPTGLTDGQRRERKREYSHRPFVRMCQPFSNYLTSSFLFSWCLSYRFLFTFPFYFCFSYHSLLVLWMWDVYKSMSGQRQQGGLAFSRLPDCVCLLCIGNGCSKRNCYY